jgi:hypothetical protein
MYENGKEFLRGKIVTTLWSGGNQKLSKDILSYLMKVD